MEKWFLTMKKADFQAIADRFHISPITARLIRNRDVTEEKEIDHYLNGTVADLLDGMLMKDMDKAAEILQEKIRENSRIRVIGDYDIDGVNATYILKEGLNGLGADVDTDIPDRIRDGYGLNRLLVERAWEDGIDTIITCDNGIAAAEEIAYGKELGMTVIVTDHHEVPFSEENGERVYQLPPADAVVDPKRVDCPYPFKGLCGAAVAYKLMEVLYDISGNDSEDIDFLMENVAIATVGDVMDLIGENRIFVKQGLEMLQRTQNPGLKALIECTGISQGPISAYHIGFVLGPCINASGRLNTAKKALALLETKDWPEAVVLAKKLKDLNDSRKEMTEKSVKQALELVETDHYKEERILVLYLSECHESIAGIVAGRVREACHKPTLVLTDAEDGIKGSGRSVEAYDMFAEMSACKELFTKFGGHKMAVGVSMPRQNLEIFRKKINALCTLQEEDLAEKVKIDMLLPFPYITEALVKETELLQPFGKGNPRPLFAEKNLKILHPQVLGRYRNVLKFQVENPDGVRMDAVYFGDAVRFLACTQMQESFSLVFYPGIHEYMGRRSLQLTVTNYQ